MVGRGKRAILPQSHGQREATDEPICNNASFLSCRRASVVSRTISMVGKDGELLLPK
jgi:hypothetical protein